MGSVRLHACGDHTFYLSIGAEKPCLRKEIPETYPHFSQENASFVSPQAAATKGCVALAFLLP